MIKLIDPKRQEELEDVIVQLQIQVNRLTNEVERLNEASRRNQRDIHKVHREVQEAYVPKTNPWDAVVTYVDPVVGRNSMARSDYDKWVESRREIYNTTPTRGTRSLDSLDSWMSMMTTPVATSVSRFGDLSDDDF